MSADKELQDLQAETGSAKLKAKARAKSKKRDTALAPRDLASEAQSAVSDELTNAGLDRVLDVMVRVSVELGRRRISIAEVLALGPGAVIEFSKAADEPLDVLVNDQLVARGQPVVMGERYGVRITEVVSPKDRLQSSGVIKECVA